MTDYVSKYVIQDGAAADVNRRMYLIALSPALAIGGLIASISWWFSILLVAHVAVNMYLVHALYERGWAIRRGFPAWWEEVSEFHEFNL